MNKISDTDPLETQEWREALASVLDFEGPDRAHFLLDELFTETRRKGKPVPYSGTTPYLNTISTDREPRHPDNRAIEHKIRSLIRWNALAIVLRANKGRKAHPRAGKPIRAESYGKEPEPRSIFLSLSMAAVRRSKAEFHGINAGNHGGQVKFPTLWSGPRSSFPH